MNPLVAMRYWGCSDFAEYFEKADLWPLNPAGEMMVLGMIEDSVGFDNIEEIVTTPGLSGLVFGHGDGSLTLGAETAMGDPSFPPLAAAREKVLKACQASGMPLGAVVGSPAAYEAAVAAGHGHVATVVEAVGGFQEVLSGPRAKR